MIVIDDMHFPDYEENKRIEYLVKHDEELEKLVCHYISSTARLMHYSQTAYDEQLSDRIMVCCSLQAGFHVDRLNKKEAS